MPPRKRPTIRILLLAAFGLLVYLKYDAFIQSSLIKSLRQPEQLWKSVASRFRKTPEPVSALAGPMVSSDSTLLQWRCASPGSDSCLDAWSGLDAGNKGLVRALIWKTRLQLDLPEFSSFTTDFRRNPPASPGTDSAGEIPEGMGESPENPLRLHAIRFLAGSRTLRLESRGDSAGGETWCVAPEDLGAGFKPACLVDPAPKPPLRLFEEPELRQERPPVLSFHTGSGEAFHPVLPGKVMNLPSGEGDWLKIYHGQLLFSYYSGYADISRGLRVGALVGIEDTLGFARRTDTSGTAGIAEGTPRAGALRLRIEKDGSPVDPLAFLGLEADRTPESDNSAGRHGR